MFTVENKKISDYYESKSCCNEYEFDRAYDESRRRDGIRMHRMISYEDDDDEMVNTIFHDDFVNDWANIIYSYYKRIAYVNTNKHFNYNLVRMNIFLKDPRYPGTHGADDIQNELTRDIFSAYVTDVNMYINEMNKIVDKNQPGEMYTPIPTNHLENFGNSFLNYDCVSSDSFEPYEDEFNDMHTLPEVIEERKEGFYMMPPEHYASFNFIKAAGLNFIYNWSSVVATEQYFYPKREKFDHDPIIRCIQYIVLSFSDTDMENSTMYDLEQNEVWPKYTIDAITDYYKRKGIIN